MRKDGKMFSFLVLFIVTANYILAANTNPDGQVSLNEAKRTALGETKLALQDFENFVERTFINVTKGNHDIINKYHRGIVNEDQQSGLHDDYADWSVLDDLPECSNQTTANNTMCIEKQQENKEDEDEEAEDTTSEENVNATHNMKRQRSTREILIQPRKRRYSDKFKELIERLPPALRRKLYNIPSDSHERIEKLSPTARRRFFENLAAHTKEKKKSQKGKKKKLKVDLGSQENVNRLHGYPQQLKQQKLRIRKYKKIYHKLDQYHQCNQAKEKWYKKPWENLKLYFKVAGQHVRLPCNVCSRPDEDVEDYKLRWMRRAADKTQLEKLNVLSVDDSDKGNKDGRFSWRGGGVLSISDLQVDDTGQYLCLKDTEYEAVHMLEVVAKEPTQQVVGKMMHKEGKGDLPEETVELDKHNLKVFTNWEPWSPCSRCDARGIKMRYGVCFVQKLDPSQPVKPKDAKVFDFFPHGIACHSNFLPSYIQSIKELLNRKSEILRSYCFVECPAPPNKKVIRGKDGKKIEVIQSSMGYKKFKKKLDKFPKIVRRKTIYVMEGDKAQVTCVRKIRPMSVVRWQKGYKILDPVELPKVTNMRMKITATHKLLLSDAKQSDKGTYSCWIDGVLRKTTKVKIYSAKRTGIKDKIAYVGVGLTVITIILIVTNIGKNRKKGRKR